MTTSSSPLAFLASRARVDTLRSSLPAKDSIAGSVGGVTGGETACGAVGWEPWRGCIVRRCAYGLGLPLVRDLSWALRAASSGAGAAAGSDGGDGGGDKAGIDG